MHYNNNPKRFVFTVAMLTFSIYSAPVYANRRKAPSDIGIKEEYLTSIGTAAAQALLIERLADHKNRRHFRGLVARLGEIDGHGRNPAVRDALIQFVSDTIPELNSKEDPLSKANSLVTLSDALRIIGYRGGDEGVKFLATLLRGEDTGSRIPDKNVRRELRGAAIVGLGLSGHPKAREILGRLKEDLGSDGAEGSLSSRIEEAFKTNLQIEQDGIDSYWKGGRKKLGSNGKTKQ